MDKFAPNIPETMEQIRLGKEAGLKEWQIKFYANPEYNPYQMALIRDGFEKRLSVEQIRLYANKDFSFCKMEMIEKAILKNFSNVEIENLVGLECDDSEIIKIEKDIDSGNPLKLS